MMFFVSNINPYCSVNNKGVEFNRWIARFEYNFIQTELAMDALIEEVRIKAAELDAEYPRSTKLIVSVTDRNRDGYYISVYPDRHPEKTVFTMSIHKVCGFYTFVEPAPAPQLEKGGCK